MPEITHNFVGKIARYDKSTTGYVKIAAHDPGGHNRGGDGKKWVFRLIDWDVQNDKPATIGPNDHYCSHEFLKILVEQGIA